MSCLMESSSVQRKILMMKGKSTPPKAMTVHCYMFRAHNFGQLCQLFRTGKPGITWLVGGPRGSTGFE